MAAWMQQLQSGHGFLWGIAMKGIILFQSKYGATEKYARWLSEKTGFSCMETRKAKAEEMQQFDALILGGGIYASGIAGLSFLKKNLQLLAGKKVVVFCVGASPYEPEAFEQIVQHNMKGELAQIPCYYCRGAWDLARMSFVDKNLCKMLRKAVGKKDPADYEIWEKALMAAGDTPCDWTDPKYIEPILQELRR